MEGRCGGFPTGATRYACVTATETSPETDVRCGRLVSVPAVVGAVRPDVVTRCGCGAGEVGWWDAGVSAVLSEVDGGLGGGVWEDGDIGVSEKVCEEEGGVSEW